MKARVSLKYFVNDCGLPKRDTDTYIYQVRPYVKTLIEEQLKELDLTKVRITFWVRWKKLKPILAI